MQQKYMIIKQLIYLIKKENLNVEGSQHLAVRLFTSVDLMGTGQADKTMKPPQTGHDSVTRHRDTGLRDTRGNGLAGNGRSNMGGDTARKRQKMANERTIRTQDKNEWILETLSLS